MISIIEEDIKHLVNIKEALISVKFSMSHPRMDGNQQLYECVQIILAVSDQKSTASLRKTIDYLREDIK
jgi:hypothetical protein